MALQIVQTQSQSLGFSFSSYTLPDFEEFAGWCETTGIGISQHTYVDSGGRIHYVALGQAVRPSAALMRLRWGSYAQP